LKLVQIYLALKDNQGNPFKAALFESVKEQLMEKFGGLTAYTRSPAEGLWMNGQREKSDDIVIFEIITPSLDVEWWQGYRKHLETAFSQEKIIITAQETTIL
jgi:hypothetical protein